MFGTIGIAVAGAITVATLVIGITPDPKTDVYSNLNNQPAIVVQATPQVPAPTEPQFGRTPITDQGSICINNRTKAHYEGIGVSREEVRYWASKYWQGWDLDVATALSVKEGQRDLNCIGDEMPTYQGRIMYGQPTNDGRHYGESVGIYQWRTVIEQTGKGGCEDKDWQLGNIERQTQCAFDKWNSKFPNGNPRHWSPWSMYTNKQYLKAIDK